MTVRCTPQDFAQLFKAGEAARFRRLDEAVIQAAREGAPVVREREPEDQGDLKKSTQTIEHPGALGAPRVVAEIIADTPYAAAQEAGTRPFWPPIAPLLGWVERHAGSLGISGDKNEVWRVAKAIQAKIAREGLKAQWFMRDSLPELRRVLFASLQHAVTKR